MMSSIDSRSGAAHRASTDTTREETENIANIRRQGSLRRSLRGARCQSVVITEKERSLLVRQDKKVVGPDGKVANKGFVRSMCKFYSDIIGGGTGERKKSLLDRSASFSAPKDNGFSLESISEKGSSDQCLSSPVSSRSSRSGSFKLNRSRSWRGSRTESEETPKRNSPTGQSVRSQDSGFSDSGENCQHDIDGSYESPDSEEGKPYVTKINIDAGADSRNHQPDHFLPGLATLGLPISENGRRRTGTTPVARQKVSGSLDNIVSLKEGLKIKLEAEPRSLYNQGYESSAGHPGPDQSTGLLQTQVMSPITANCPRFSTPVRASFRRRPQTMILVEDAHTPVVKRESRTRLKEIKSRRRWSNIDPDHSKLSPLSVNTTLNIKNSSSQFGRNKLNGEACHEFRNQERRNSNLSPSMTVLSQISPVESYQPSNLTREEQIITSPGQSYNVDGTGTRLMIESFLGQSPAPVTSRSVNTIFPNESVLAALQSDTIIEHESSSSTNQAGPVQFLNKTGQSHSVAVSNQSASHRSNQDPVYEWWKDLFVWTEPECMTYLQSKPIPTSKSLSPTAVTPSVPLVFYPYETIRYTLENKRQVLETFSLLKSHFSALNLLQMNKTIGLLTKQIRDFVYEHNLRSHSDPLELNTMSPADLPGFKSSQADRRLGGERRRAESSCRLELVSLQEKALLQIVDRLKLCAHRCQYTPNQPLVEMKKTIKNLEEAFSKFIELIISSEMKTVIGMLENSLTDGPVVDAVNTIINLGNEHSSQMYNIITKVGAIRSLISLAISTTNMEVSLLSLRALSSVCCTIESVRELEQCSGIQTITEILVNPRTSLTVKVEAAGVLAQITSPWISDNHSIAGLAEQVPHIVEQLTKLARVKAGDDTFLLVSAALANLTFMEAGAVVAMQQNGTARALMKVVSESPFTSLFAKDQVVTVMANLASKEACRTEILAEDGLCFLVSLLSTNPDNTATPAETAAAERVLKKTAIALSRLCSDPAVCKDLSSLGGLRSLVCLVKDGELRNYNDAVLVACLAVLRRVAHHSGHHVFDDLDARDLIDPKLMDSFLEYSSKQESYV